MKSIKEKAEEYSMCIASSEYTREDFVSGANYVLEEIEKLVKFNRWAAQDLYKLIEQLKSNQ